VRLLVLAPGSPFINAGLQPGDIIQEVDTTRVFGAGDLFQVLEARAEQGILVVDVIFLRDGEARIIEMELP